MFGGSSSFKESMRGLGVGLGAVGDPLAMASGLFFESLWPEDKKEDKTQSPDYKTAELLRDQYEDWKRTFQPVELSALNDVSMLNQGVLPNALNKSEEMVSNTYGAMKGVLERGNAALGISPTEQQLSSSRRLMDLSQSAATATAKNNTRSATRQLDEMLISGATPNPNVAKG
jgi:hypothetical protein